LLSLIYEGILGDQNKYDACLVILLDHIIDNPSKTNDKIIQCELPKMMLLGNPNPALKKLFLSAKEEGEAQSEIWLKITDESLPSHYNVENYMENIVKKDGVKTMDQIKKICIDKRDNCSKAQNIKAFNLYQEFDLYNLRELACSGEFKPMTNF
jgi:hypothetical protein